MNDENGHDERDDPSPPARERHDIRSLEPHLERKRRVRLRE
jgi:hypothetical protein